MNRPHPSDNAGARSAPGCLPPLLEPAAVHGAARLIGPFIRETPLLRVILPTATRPVEVYLKLEFLQHTGSFKPRGALNRILSTSVPAAGLVTASGGNHGAAVAYAGRLFHRRTQVFVPRLASPAKLKLLKGYGATVTLAGETYADALGAARDHAGKTGALLVEAFEHPLSIAGHGTIGLEIERQLPGCTTILVAVGGGGMIAGLAACFGRRVRLVSVEPEQCASFARALEAGTPVTVPPGGIAADSLGTPRAGDLAFATAQAVVQRAILVSDEDIAAAQRVLWEECRLVTEPGGATALAAVLSGQYLPLPDERVAVILCGGNTALDSFNASVTRAAGPPVRA